MELVNRSEAFSRCKKIFTKENPKEKMEEIYNSLSMNYSLDDCFRDILTVSEFDWMNILTLILDRIKENDKTVLDAIFNNFYCMSPKILEFFIGSNEIYGELLSRFDQVFSKCGSFNQYAIISKILSTDDGQAFLENEIKNNDLIEKSKISSKELLINYLLKSKDGTDYVIHNFEKFFSDSMSFIMIEQMILNGVSENKFIENKNKVLNSLYGNDVIKFIQWLSSRNEFDPKDITIEQFIKRVYYYIEDKTNLKTIQMLYESLMKKQGPKELGIKDIEYVGKGSTSSVHRIGKFCIKIGDHRISTKMPYHKRFIKPLLRQETNPNNSNSIFVEIQNAVDNMWYRGMSDQEIDEELYKIYKELRDEGIIWTDIIKENVGRLLRPNKSNYYIQTLEGNLDETETLRIIDQELEPSEETIGMTNIKDEECLPAGKLVIIDTDKVFFYKDIQTAIKRELAERKEQGTFLSKYLEFEDTYTREQELKKKLEEEQQEIK